MQIALAQINPRIGDWEGNLQIHIQAIEKAKKSGAQLVVFPELSLCGYPPMDLLNYPTFVDKGQIFAQKLADLYPEIGILLGAPVPNLALKSKPLLNAALFLYNKIVQLAAAKTLLPDYDVFNENRYFASFNQFSPIQFNGINIGVSICEDIWFNEMGLYANDPLAHWEKIPCDLHINLSASPFAVGKPEQRFRLLEQAAKRLNTPLIYVNQIGANTDLVFDGGSCISFPNASTIVLNEFVESIQTHTFFQNNNPKQIQKKPTNSNVIEQALILGISDFFAKNGFDKAVIGLSGGIDSALVAYLATKALGKANVTVLLMPSAFSSEHSIDDALALVNNLGIQYHIIPINDCVDSFSKSLAPYFKDLPFSIAEENLQSRVRGTLLMAWANKFGHILLNTSNKSELAVGYGTLYGDMCGALAVIGDLFKTQVYELCDYINTKEEIIPNNIIKKAPSAELRPNQKDADSLPDYSILDKILEAYLNKKWETSEIIQIGFDKELVEKVIKLVKLSEFKRYQSAPVIRISSNAFGFGRLFPLVGKY